MNLIVAQKTQKCNAASVGSIWQPQQQKRKKIIKHISKKNKIIKHISKKNKIIKHINSLASIHEN